MSGSSDTENLMLKLANALWVVLVALLILFAVYVSAGRLLVGAVADYQEPLLRALSRQLPVQLQAREVVARWRGYRPQLILRDLSLRDGDSAAVLASLKEGRATIDVWGSLRSSGLRVGRLQLSGLDLQGELSADGEFRLLGLGRSPNDTGGWVEELLLDLERVVLLDNVLHLRLPDGSVQALSLDLSLLRDGSRRQLRAELQTRRGTAVTLLADGLGNPFHTAQYSGDVYTRLQVTDLAGLESWLPALADLPFDVAGAAELEFWLGWRRGEPLLDARFDASGLRVSGTGRESWKVPLEQLSGRARAQLLEQGWQVQVSDLDLRQGEQRQRVPALGLELRGDSVRLRASELPLSMLRLLAGADSPLPTGLGDALATLQPAGLLPAFELRLEDRDRPAASWSAAARFEKLDLASWRGAPGVRGASGWLRLAPGQGRVLLDSSSVALNFPTVYREPLHWDTLRGAIDLNWTPDWLRLASGPLVASGEEGVSRALFGLDVPLRRGLGDIDMQLLVGIQDADPRYRDKYLPYILPAGLLDWLSTSLEEGRVRQGAFVWRGSLRPGARDERTVQLFFDVAEARLRFDPRWPALADLSGSVVIDDTRVSIWSQQARLFDSQVARLSGETWRDDEGELRLLVDAELAGPAGDGLRVLNRSPLAEPLQGALNDWRADGRLAARLGLDLPLVADGRPPAVELALDLDDIDLQIRPGGLELESLAGAVGYVSGRGFSGRDLQARLWGNPLRLKLEQNLGRPGGFVPGPVHLLAEGDVAVQSASGWLGLPDTLPLEGGARLQGRLSFQAGDAPRLELRSDLRGVEIDLPFPFDKPADAPLPLTLVTALGGESLRLDLQLAHLLQARIALRGGRPEALSLAFQDRALPLRAGELRVSGQLPELDLDAWRAALTSSLGGDGEASPGPLQLRVEALQLDTLLALGRDWRHALLDLQRQPESWQLQLETRALKGRLSLADGGGRGEVHLQSLDLGALPAGAAGAGTTDPGQWQALPDLEVSIERLLSRGREWGELAFQLAFAADGVYASAIRGEFPGLAVSDAQPASLFWGSEGTQLQAGLRVGDLGQSLAALDYQRILETRGGAVGVDLRWPGSPGDFALAASDGVLRIDLRDGRFLDAPASASGTLRVVSILNLADLIQRLSLSQVFESGISFDRFRGDMLFREGRVRVPELEVVGAGSTLVFRGESGIAERSLSGELVATLPVASNLPWVAALAAGLPVAAGVYVVSKVFEKQVSQLSSAVYRLGGTWDDPQLRLDRIFDLEQRDQSSTSSPAEASESASSRQ